jgi:hypothetical protein
MLWPALGLAAILCTVFYPYLFGGKIMLPTDMYDTMTAPSNAQYGPPQAQNHYFYDGIVQTYPYKIETQEGLRSGHFAYWNPHILGGYPQYAETMANNFDPFNVLLLWTSPIMAIHLEIIIELFIAGMGMLFLLRYFGILPMIALVFASAYMLNSMFITTASVRWAAASFCWMPYTALTLVKFLESTTWKHLLFASVFLGLSFLGGNLQSAFFVAFIVTILVLTYPSNVSKWSRLTALIALGTISFSLSAPMWIPTLELFFQTIFFGGSLNSSNVYDTYSVFHRLLTIPFLAMFAFPEIFGSPQIFSAKSIAGLDITNFQGAIGFLPTLFGLWGCFILWCRKEIRPFILIALSGMLLPIVTPLYSIVYHRFFILSSFSLIIIGAVCFQHALHSNSALSITKILKSSAFLVGLLAALLVGMGVSIILDYHRLLGMFSQYLATKIQGSAFGVGNGHWMLDRVRTTLAYYSFGNVHLWIGIVTAGIGLSLLTRYRSGKIRMSALLVTLLVLTVFQLIAFARLWMPSIDPNTFPVYPDNPIVSFLQRNDPSTRYATWRDTTQDPNLLPSNSSDVYHLNDFDGYESLTCRSMSIFYKRHVHRDSVNLRLLGLACVKYIVTRSRQIYSQDATPVFSASGLTIYQNNLCKPRAYLSYHARILSSDSDVTKEMLRDDYNGSVALFTKSNAPEFSRIDNGRTESGDSIHLIRAEDEELNLITETKSKALLILTDTYYPGWKCYVNGDEEHIYRVNDCMRAIVVGPGKSLINFRFEPDTFRAGLGLSAATILALGCLFFLQKKRLAPAQLRTHNRIV